MVILPPIDEEYEDPFGPVPPVYRTRLGRAGGTLLALGCLAVVLVLAGVDWLLERLRR